MPKHHEYTWRYAAHQGYAARRGGTLLVVKVAIVYITLYKHYAMISDPSLTTIVVIPTFLKFLYKFPTFATFSLRNPPLTMGLNTSPEQLKMAHSNPQNQKNLLRGLLCPQSPSCNKWSMVCHLVFGVD